MFHSRMIRSDAGCLKITKNRAFFDRPIGLLPLRIKYKNRDPLAKFTLTEHNFSPIDLEFLVEFLDVGFGERRCPAENIVDVLEVLGFG